MCTVADCGGEQWRWRRWSREYRFGGSRCRMLYGVINHFIKDELCGGGGREIRIWWPVIGMYHRRIP